MLTPRQIAQTLNLDDILILADGALDLAFEHFNALVAADPDLLPKLNATVRLVERVASIHKTVAQIHATFNQSTTNPTTPNNPTDPADPTNPTDPKPLFPPDALTDIEVLKNFIAEHRPIQSPPSNTAPNTPDAASSAAAHDAPDTAPDDADYSRRLKARISDIKIKYAIPVHQRLQNALDTLATVTTPGATPDAAQPAGAQVHPIARPIRPLDPDAVLPGRTDQTDHANGANHPPRQPYTFVPDPANQSPRACPLIQWKQLIPFALHTVTLAQDIADQEITADPNWALNRLLALDEQHNKQLAANKPDNPKEFPKNTTPQTPKAPSIQNVPPVHVVRVPSTPPPDTS